jgi:hypothetical protein
VGPAGGKKIANDAAPFDPSPIIGAGKQHIVWAETTTPDKGCQPGLALFGSSAMTWRSVSFLSDAELAWMSKGHGVYCRRDLSNNGIALERVHPTQKPSPSWSGA